MRTFVTILVASSMVLAGCSGFRDSRMNPGNWFGKSSPRPAATTNAAQNNPLIPAQTGILNRDKREVYLGTPVDQVTKISIEHLPTGAIIHVTGISLRQGAHDIQLLSDTNGDPVDGVLTLGLAAVQPDNRPQGSKLHRTVHVGRFVSLRDLEATRTIRIVAARNVQTISH